MSCMNVMYECMSCMYVVCEYERMSCNVHYCIIDDRRPLSLLVATPTITISCLLDTCLPLRLYITYTYVYCNLSHCEWLKYWLICLRDFP